MGRGCALLSENATHLLAPYPALSNLRLDTGGQLDFCEGRVARARRYGARALILGRSLRTPSQKPNCSAGAPARFARGVEVPESAPQVRARRIAGQDHTLTTLASEAADRPSLVPVVGEGRVDAVRAEEELIRESTIMGSRGPIFAGAAGNAQRTDTELTCGHKV